jgi:hypothetical protein
VLFELVVGEQGALLVSASVASVLCAEHRRDTHIPRGVTPRGDRSWQASDLCEEAGMTQPDPSPQPKPGYRETIEDPASVLVCQRCGALVSDTATDLHDRFHVSVGHPATMPSTMTRS